VCVRAGSPLRAAVKGSSRHWRWIATNLVYHHTRPAAAARCGPVQAPGASPPAGGHLRFPCGTLATYTRHRVRSIVRHQTSLLHARYLFTSSRHAVPDTPARPLPPLALGRQLKGGQTSSHGLAQAAARARVGVQDPGACAPNTPAPPTACPQAQVKLTRSQPRMPKTRVTVVFGCLLLAASEQQADLQLGQDSSA